MSLFTSAQKQRPLEILFCQKVRRDLQTKYLWQELVQMQPHVCLQASLSLSCHIPALLHRHSQKGARLARLVCCFCRQCAVFHKACPHVPEAVLVLALQVGPAVFCGRVCEAEGCGTLSPANNYPSEKGGRFCAKHRLPGMVRTCCRGARRLRALAVAHHSPGPPGSFPSIRHMQELQEKINSSLAGRRA